MDDANGESPAGGNPAGDLEDNPNGADILHDEPDVADTPRARGLEDVAGKPSLDERRAAAVTP